jgi:hypothetical protein
LLHSFVAPLNWNDLITLRDGLADGTVRRRYQRRLTVARYARGS